MDRTTRLIQWQRVTIAVLFSAVLTLGLAYNRERDQAASLAEFNDTIVDTSRRRATMLHQEREKSARIIRVLDERLRRYKTRYGEISPIREGVTVGHLGLKPQVDR